MPDCSYAQHVHRFAAWAAARAASTTTCRFSVAHGKAWIELIPDLVVCAGKPENLPTAREFDARHEQWRQTIIDGSGHNKITHGTAAKLINVYLKASVVHCGFENTDSVKAIHPPIDRLLLLELTKARPDIWRGQKLAWSTFDAADYELAIARVRTTLGDGVALWKIEEHWAGHQ